MFIYFITIFAFVLRLVNINKPEGLWNDEYVSWFVSNTAFNNGFWNEVIKQCHMPLYYLYLKPFSNMSDIILRFTSVVPAVVAVPVMYFVGKEYSKRVGYFAASITAVLSFLVYYSQEVRFYSLLFLLSSLSLLFLIRYIKRGKCLVGFITVSILILLTHVLGGIYVLAAFFYLIYKKKSFPKAGVIVGLVLLGLGVIFGGNLLKMLPVSQWWGVFSYTNILFLFTDFLSPILTNNINAPAEFIYSKDIFLNLFMIIPTLVALIGICKSCTKEKGLVFIAVFTIVVMSLLAFCGKIVFITKYSIEILPILILLISIGFESFKFGKFLLFIFLGFHIAAVFTPYYTAKIYRGEGHKLVCDILNKNNPDKIVYTYYDSDRFQRYLEKQFPSFYISKLNRYEYVDSPSRILDNIEIGERVSVVFLDSVSFIPQNLLEEAVDKNLPEMFVIFSMVKHSLIKALNTDYNNFQFDRSGNWTVITATRYK